MKRLQALQRIPPASCVFLLALAVCIVYNLTVARDYFPLHDSAAYQALAFHLLDEHCYCWLPHVVTASHAPLWPFLIAGLSLIVGRADIFDRLFLCLLDAGTCVLIYYFARDLFSKRVALIIGLVACVYPALYIYTGWLYTEALSTFLQTAVCFTVLRIQRNEGKDLRLWALCGILLGLLALSHPNCILIVGVVALWVIVLVWRRKLPQKALVGGALAVVVAGLLIAPWTIRNYVVSGDFVPIATGSGAVLRGAYNDVVMSNQEFLGSWYNPDQLKHRLLGPPIAPGPCPARCEIQTDGEATAAAVEWVETHQSELPLLMFYHLRNFFTPYTAEADMPMDRFPLQISSQIVLEMSRAFPIPIFVLAAVGLVVTMRRYWHELLFAYLIIAATIGEILIFYGNSRFRSLIEPLLLVLAAGALWWLTDSGAGTLRWRHGQRWRDSGADAVRTRSQSEPTAG